MLRYDEQNGGFRASKPSIRAHNALIGGRAERQPRVAGDSRLNPARVGQPDQPDDLAGVGRKLLTGLSFHGGDSFRGKIQ